MFSRLRQIVRAHPVAAFYALTFPLSWRGYLVSLFRPGGEVGLDPYGPLVAAVVITALVGGGPGLKAWGRTLLRWRASTSLYVFAVFFPLLVTLLGIGANVALGAVPPSAERWSAWPTLLVAFPLVMVLGGPLGEEPAWRGFALARVSKRRSMLQATLLVGVVWFAWHLPLLVTRPGEVVPGAVGILSASVLLGWLYERSGGVVLLPLLMHTAQNTFGGEFAGPMFSGADLTRLSWLRAGLYLVTALVLVLRDARFRTGTAGIEGALGARPDPSTRPPIGGEVASRPPAR
jgi:membrane protease YdiL (CAAX protease family)